jgi:hypothetical protein
MIPLLLAAPAGRPARVLGAGSEVVPVLQNLDRVAWPVVLHEPTGGGPLKGFPGVQFSTTPPAAASLRQSSLVFITTACPPAWRDAARKDLEGSGVPLWDSADPKASTVRFPVWVPGVPVSMALWGIGGSRPWEALLAEDFARSMEGLYGGLLDLAAELRSLVFQNDTDEVFREKVVAQLTRPEITTLLIRGEYEQAKTLALKIVGTTTRSLE